MKSYPIHHLKPVDGIAITADVWQEAHDHHRLELRYHARFAHGAGILHGLRVLPSDPVDTGVYVEPGMAVDSEGNLIIVPEAVRFDFGEMTGALRLTLSYGESEPRGGLNASDPNLLYVTSAFSIEAHPAPPNTPHVELARVFRDHRAAPLRAPLHADSPGNNEIDTRYRQELQPLLRNQPALPLAVGTIGASPNDWFALRVRGIRAAARACAHHARALRPVVDTLNDFHALPNYAFLYLCLAEAAPPSVDTLTAVYNFLNAGGSVLAECQAMNVLEDLAQSLGVTLQALPSDHALLASPYLFAAPPAGNTDGDVRIGQLGKGQILLSSRDYAALFAGMRHNAPASREDIRAAHEFFENILSACSALAEAA